MICGWCSGSLALKRKGAKFCSASCRVQFSRAGKRPKLSRSERSRCRSCVNHKCHLHNRTSGSERYRRDTTMTHPLFRPGRVSEWPGFRSARDSDRLDTVAGDSTPGRHVLYADMPDDMTPVARHRARQIEIATGAEL